MAEASLSSPAPAALGIQVPDSFKTIGNVLNFAQQAQALKTAQQEYERGGVALERERGTMRPAITTAEQQAQQQEIATNLAKFKLTGEYAQKGRDISQSLVNDPDFVSGNIDGMIPKILSARQTMIESGVPPSVAEVQTAHLLTAASTNPKAVRQALMNSIQVGIGSTGQNANMTATGIPVTNQQQSSVVSNTPMAGIPVGQAIPGTEQQQELPPTTPSYDSGTKTPGYVGPQPRGQWLGKEPQGNFSGDLNRIKSEIESIKDPIVREEARRALQNQTSAPASSRQRIQASPGVAEVATEEGKVKSALAHFDELKANAAIAPLLEGIAQNIKTYASKAITGTGQERLAMLNGILAQLGVPRANDLKTATDDLEKNMAQLAKASPASTDAARIINQLANPHITMNEKAILDSADQIIGQVRMAKSAYSHFLPHQLSGNNAAYLKAIEDFPGDARVWQFAALDEAGRARMKAGMRAEDWPSFKKKIEKAEELGLIK